MKKRFLALAGILFVLATLTFIVPIGVVRANLETKACPGSVCIINNAVRSGAGIDYQSKWVCSLTTYTCAVCCDLCSNYEKTIGNANRCGCEAVEPYDLP